MRWQDPKRSTRVEWFRRGLASGDSAMCDTFGRGP
jgi:predicted metalloprotease